MPRPGRPRRDSRLAIAGVGVHGRSIRHVCQLGQVRALFARPFAPEIRRIPTCDCER